MARVPSGPRGCKRGLKPRLSCFPTHTLLSPSPGPPYRSAAPGGRSLLGLPVKRGGRREGQVSPGASELGQDTDSKISGIKKKKIKKK